MENALTSPFSNLFQSSVSDMSNLIMQLFLKSGR